MNPVQRTPEASSDIGKLERGVDRAEVALEALKECELTPKQVQQLEALLKRVSAPSATTSPAVGEITPIDNHQDVAGQNEFDNSKAFREGPPREVLLSYHADRILGSFSLEGDRVWKAKIMSFFGRQPMLKVCLSIPADISDEDAMHALNARFREMFPEKDRAAIYEEAIELILDAGNGSGRRARGPRVIKLLAVVPGTTEKTRDQQAKVLKQRGLTFPHPIEQALAAAAYACKRSGEDLFNGNYVRGSVPGGALITHRGYGVVLSRYYEDAYSADDFAASGYPSPGLK